MASTTEEFWFPVNIPFSESVGHNTLITKYESGKEQRRKKWSVPKRTYSVELKAKTDIVTTQLWNFYNSRSGAFDTFYFQNPNENPVSSEGFGTGNGVSTIFNLVNSPIPSGSFTVTAAGVAKTETTDYTVNRLTGAITFNSAVASGEALLATYNFVRTVRFADDNLNRELFSYKLYNGTLKLIQVIT